MTPDRQMTGKAGALSSRSSKKPRRQYSLITMLFGEWEQPIAEKRESFPNRPKTGI
jgi:hypothetical protein